ncbi:UDP-N-acetylmuramate--L-alanine ligase [Portibacter lacus]|uniref:Peptidoglycan synthetase n=1 Tax=Portibacter lacus TaxID=1099794 RepID=A0AA37SNA2_9BACT|nr:Mur ligase domain-containing protein [Portibacter lacus]GLR16179.1 peptidoglycan synthetase [Portibacter lacus]
MRIHIIAVGGRIMHTLALNLAEKGHRVSGSDDEIYEPSKSKLAAKGLLPSAFGWDENRISEDIDLIILGMHARADNPELIKAQKLNIEILSYPAFIYKMSKDKKRIVVAGSHGKTSTTAMIMHVLKFRDIDFDYLIGAELDGFGSMIRLTDAPIIVIEGDEYLSSSIDRRPKMIHYRPDISIITGIAWDHVNVFKTEIEYNHLFDAFIETHDEEAPIFAYAEDNNLDILAGKYAKDYNIQRYHALEKLENGNVVYDNKQYKIRVFGKHNRANMMAALQVCLKLGIRPPDFFAAISTFKGASKRLEVMHKTDDGVVYRDFAHAPSKVKATVDALKEHFPDRKIVAFLELHTFSSLNSAFLPKYSHSLDSADEAYVYYSPHTLSIKHMPALDKEEVAKAFNKPGISVLDDKQELQQEIEDLELGKSVIVFMSSGNFDKIDVKGILIKKI